MTDIAITVPEMLDLLEYRLKLREEPPVVREERTSGICDSCDSYSEDLKFSNGKWLCEDCREDLSVEE
jgi:formylmethanofuran dehydrogenase subunit E